MGKEEEDMEEDKNDMISRKDGQRNDHTQRDRYRCYSSFPSPFHVAILSYSMSTYLER